MRWVLVLGFLAVVGCGTDQQHAQLDIYNDTTAVNTTTIQDIIVMVNAITPNGSTINLDNYSLTVWDTLEALRKQCQDTPKVVGCTSIHDKLIDTVWLSGLNGTTIEQENGYSAGILAHELGHIYYHQTTGDADATHKHQEWFSEDPSVDSVRNSIYHAFYRN
jgi:hypothetical protein